VRSGALPPWAVAVADGTPPPPVVLLLGGFLTSPPSYRPFARRLLAHGAAAVVTADVWLPDWLIATRRGIGPIVGRSARALLAASARSADTSLRAPVLVVGHSAGGLNARLLTSPVPFRGRRLNGAGRIGAIVTLGTPHHVRDEGRLGARVGAEAVTFANAVVPGPAFAPTTGYLAVGSGAVAGRRDGVPRERRTWAVYQALNADPSADELRGDGLVPLSSSLLEGAPSMTLEGAVHGQWPGDWYGSEGYLRLWWPRAVATWEAALTARVALAATERPSLPAAVGAFDGSGDRG
jgi:hypothetical protein